MYKAKFVIGKHPNVKLETDKPYLLDDLRNHWSIPNPVAKFSKWADLSLCAITPLGSFLPGLTLDIVQYISETHPDVQIELFEIKDLVFPYALNLKEAELLKPANEKFEYRDYQMEAIQAGLKHGRGIFHYATASGKSLIIYGLIRNILSTNPGFKTLILVPGIQLVRQMHGDFIEYGCDPNDVCMFSSFSKDQPSAKIIVSNREWLENHSEELPSSDVIIIDEVHTIKKKNKVSAFVRDQKTHIRFGFTGTLPENQEDIWNIIGLCGRILKVKTPAELQEKGWIAGINILSLLFQHPKGILPKVPDNIEEPLERAKAKFPIEWHYVEDCEKTNRLMCSIMLKLKGNSIALFDHIEHGDKLLEIVNGINLKDGLSKQVFLINGSTPLDYREEVRKKMEENDNCILLANCKCFGVGVNIKNINNILFMFSSGTAATKIIQAIGRGLRKSEFKNKLLLVDFYHSFKYSAKHCLERIQMYKQNYSMNNFVSKQIKV